MPLFYAPKEFNQCHFFCSHFRNVYGFYEFCSSIDVCIDFIYLIYIYFDQIGTDEMSKAFTELINNDIVRTKLESDDFVAIRVHSDSEAYLQFAAICKVSHEIIKQLIPFDNHYYKSFDELIYLEKKNWIDAFVYLRFFILFFVRL